MTRNTIATSLAALMAGLILLLAPAAFANHSLIQQVSTSTSATGNDDATFAGESADGSTVYFQTRKPVLSADTDGNCNADPDAGVPPQLCLDVYKLSGNSITLVSAGSGGNGSADAKFKASSRNGVRVAFETTEPLLASDTDARSDVYLVIGSTTYLVSTGANGGNGDFDANYVGSSENLVRIFFTTEESLVSSDTDTAVDLYEYNTGTATTTLLSTGPNGGNNDSYPAFFAGSSKDGTSVFFETEEPLVSTDTDNGCGADPDLGVPAGPCRDVYKRSGGSTTLISTGSNGSSGSTEARFTGVSDDGTHAYFETSERLEPTDTDSSTDVYQRYGGATELISTGPAGGNAEVGASFDDVTYDGTRVFFQTAEALTTNDLDQQEDIYQRSGGVTTLMSTGSTGGNGPWPAKWGGITRDGKQVFFETRESLVSYDTDTGCHEQATDPPGPCTDVYKSTGSTIQLTSASSTSNGSYDAGYAGTSQGGTHVFFTTTEPIYSADTDLSNDVYEATGGFIYLLSNGITGGNGAFDAEFGGISDDGSRMYFETAEQLMSGDTSSGSDVYGRYVAQPAPCTHRYTPAEIPDFAGQLNALPDDAVVCLDGVSAQYGSEKTTQTITNNRLTVRSTPQHLAGIQTRLWVTGDDVTFSNLTLNGQTTPASTAPTITVNGDRDIFTNLLVTNGYSTAGSCFYNNGADTGGSAVDLTIKNSVIYDCGADATKDYGIKLGSATRPQILDNWIYENAAGGVQIGPATTNGLITHNVISDNCAKVTGCKGNLIYTEDTGSGGNTNATSGNNVTNNTVAFPYSGLNADDYLISGLGNAFTSNCVWRSDGSAGVGLPTPQFTVSYTTANPNFADRTTPVHAFRDYSIPAGNPCDGKEPIVPPSRF